VPRPPHGRPLFRGGFFAYYEDTELGWRTRRAGGGCVFAPRAVVRHVHGAAAGDRSAVFAFHNERNRVLTALLHADLVAAVYAAGTLTAKAVLRRSRPLARAVVSAAVRGPGMLGGRAGLVGGG
jgi:GT2 family glycosyltransferase